MLKNIINFFYRYPKSNCQIWQKFNVYFAYKKMLVAEMQMIIAADSIKVQTKVNNLDTLNIGFIIKPTINTFLKDRNYTIDLLRFCAATMVVFFHFNAPIPYINNFYRNSVKFGWLGVPIFFMISGYCILLTANNSKNSFDFLIRRFFRIYPAYWFSLGIVTSVVLIHLLINRVNDVAILPKTLFSVFSTIILYIEPISDIKSMSWVYWSLTFEVCFYLIISIGLVISRKYLVYFILIILCISISVNPNSNGIWWCFLKDWPCFALGVSIYYFHTINTKKDIISAVTLFSLSVIAILYKNPITNYSNVPYILTCFISFLIILGSKKNKLKPNFFSSLADYSYSIYLLHVPIGIYLLGFLRFQLLQTNIFLNICIDLAIYFVVLVISVLVFKYVEKPSINFGKFISVNLFGK